MTKREILVWSLRIILSATFCFSAYTKLIAPGIIEIILVDHGLAATREVAGIYVRLLIGLEFSLGLLFLQPYLQKKVIIPSSFIFLIAFTLYLVYTGFVLGDKDNCGCFGEMIKMSPAESIIKNIILMIIDWILFVAIKEEKKKKIIPMLIIVISYACVFIISPVKRVKEFKFSSYTNFVGAGRVDLASGDKLLAVFNTECDHCQEVAKELSKIRNTKNFPELYVLFFTEGSVSIDSFKAITKSNFPYHLINVNEFFNLIGQSPPIVYWLKDGKINAVWERNIMKNIVLTFLADKTVRVHGLPG